ncbi:ureide permease 1 isoform X1 [Jatropha curcas]|uniref:ureide permease 1 isoform X1 n=1 Tax=Jatropha curcas TaxID=180498 RepID=UPI0018931168|nr:ureide permease 1 isoform X1 [Jatropha curcas]
MEQKEIYPLNRGKIILDIFILFYLFSLHFLSDQTKCFTLKILTINRRSVPPLPLTNINSQEFLEIPTLISLPIERIISSGLKVYLVESKAGAIACMLLSLFCLGTWPAILTLLERRGRLPQHTYLDYSITNLLAALFFAFTFGEMGKSTPETPNFINQLSKLNENWPSVMFAMAGGIVLSLGNICMQYALAFVGLTVTEVIAASLTVVIGTTLNYFLDDRINKAEILFPGVGCFLIAVCLASALHASNAADNSAKLNSLPSDCNLRTETEDTTIFKNVFSNNESTVLENGIKNAEKIKFGTIDFLVELENRRAIKVFRKSTFIGLFIIFSAGVCFSLFSPAFNLATNDQFNTLKKGVAKLVVYTAFFWFSVSCFVLAIILNITFLYRPVLNLPRSSVKAYLKDWNGRGLAFLAGLLCGLGNGLQFMGGEAAGYAAADAVQALPLVGTFWGILLFGEYRRSSRKTHALLVSMLFMFVVAVAVLIASAGSRK